MAEWKAALRHSSGAKSKLRVVHIGDEHLGSSIISRWLRDPAYLNRAGRPDDLPLRGKRSITSLLEAGKVTIPPSTVVALLIELGTVIKVAHARYRLLRRVMNYSIPDYLPFEPNFRFLVDAARACTWGSGIPPNTPRLFWQNAYSMNIDRKYVPEFLRFAKERGLTFMHEINDWLESHECVRTEKVLGAKKRKNMRRLGMGLFGICSDPR
jgi:hypothetical protein